MHYWNVYMIAGTLLNPYIVKRLGGIIAKNEVLARQKAYKMWRKTSFKMELVK